MASTSVQSRISDFESRRFDKYPPQNLLETPLSPSASTLAPILPQITPPRPPRSPSPSPPNLGRKTSLIDLKDWIVDDGPSGRSPPSSSKNASEPSSVRNTDFTRTPTQNGFRGAKKPQIAAPLINLESPPKSKAARASNAPPPLPPRKPSYSSLKQAAASSSPQPSASLTVNTTHTYPPPFNLTLPNGKPSGENSARPGLGFGHAPASSISSFHSVSLSSDGGNSTDRDPGTPGSVSSNHIATFPVDRGEFQATPTLSPVVGNGTGSSGHSNTGVNRNTNGTHDLRHQTSWNSSEADSVSLDESYENVSTTSCGSPSTNAIISMDWERAMAKTKQAPFPYSYTPRSSAPPRLPARPASSASVTKNAVKPPPPAPPPPRSVPASPRVRPASSASSSGSASSSATSSTTVAPRAARRKPPPPPPPSSYIVSNTGTTMPSPTSTSSRPPSFTPSVGSSRAGSRISLTSNSASDRSSIISTSTSTSRSSYIGASQPPGGKAPAHYITSPNSKHKSPLMRPAFVPVAARRRYERVFDGNVAQARKADRALRKLLKSGVRGSEKSAKPARLNLQQAKGLRTRQAAGWRGLSVDLITGLSDDEDEGDDSDGSEKGKGKDRMTGMEEDEEEWEDIGPKAEGDERLDGYVVRLIWQQSRLDRHKLRDIWLECDPTNTGSLSREAFIKGMWRIDEELRRARIRSSTASTSSLSSLSARHAKGLPTAIMGRKDRQSANAASAPLRRVPPPLA
ncbi:hypothetical protein HGRIS_012743 [Hohenbuehelia grisea]|uniref:EH domain-containing protein n=1 Tax=Hohenbuehelia grisea TaxID=104357 RepID=A0ABR3IT77_9AGAR